MKYILESIHDVVNMNAAAKQAHGIGAIKGANDLDKGRISRPDPRKTMSQLRKNGLNPMNTMDGAKKTLGGYKSINSPRTGTGFTFKPKSTPNPKLPK